MESYDTRLRKQAGGATFVYCTIKESDVAAIQAAREMADDGDTMEVWKGMSCIYMHDKIPAGGYKRAA